MKPRYSRLPPDERAEFLSEKTNDFLKALARELEWLDPSGKASAPDPATYAKIVPNPVRAPQG